MQKVYLVSSGSYSDYMVEKVFTTEALAKEWIGAFNKDYCIEERDLDNMSDKQVIGYYEACIYFEDAKVLIYPGKSIERGSFRNTPIFYQIVDVVGSTSYVPKMTVYFPPDYDEERITKVLADTRAHLMVHNGYNIPKTGVYRKSNFEYLGSSLYNILENARFNSVKPTGY